MIGEHAHIVGEKEESPRGKSPLNAEERASYHNHVLLCPNDHTEIDKNVTDWPVEKLHLYKSKHELWVKETLSSGTDLRLAADELAITTLIDDVVSSCSLHSWNEWAENAVGYDGCIPKERPSVYRFRVRVAAAIVPPNYEEIGRAATTVAILLQEFYDTFTRHLEEDGERLRAERFYKSSGFNRNYDADLLEFERWVERYSRILLEATKAVNWFADVVRRDVNPMFFVEHGKFVLHEGLCSDFKFHCIIPEYSEEDKQDLPAILTEVLPTF